MGFLEFKFPDGHVFYLNHLISFLVIFGFILYFCIKLNSQKFDKALHAIISFFLTAVLIYFFGLIHLGWWWSPIIVFLIGLGKECYDRIFKKEHLFDPQDLLADVIGISTVTITYVLSFLLHKSI